MRKLNPWLNGKLLKSLAMMVLLGLSPLSSFGAVREFRAVDTPQLIPFTGTGIPGGALSSSIITVTDDATINDLNVFVDIEHTWVGDLNIYLEHAGLGGSQRIQLAERKFNFGSFDTFFGESGDNITDVTFDDEAATQIIFRVHFPPYGPASFQPFQALSAFDGRSVLGQWRLEITDNAGGDSGQILDWKIIVDGNFNDPPTIDPIADIDIGRLAQSPVIPFGIDDAETPANNLLVTANYVGGNQQLFNELQFNLGGSGNSRTLQVNAPTSLVGSVNVDISVEDGNGVVTSEPLEIFVFNQLPLIDPIPDFRISPLSVNLPFQFGVSDADSPASDLNLGIQFDGGDQSLFNDLQISLTGTGGNRAIQVNAPTHRIGFVDIDVTVSDPDGATAHEDVQIIVGNPAGPMAFSPQGFIRVNEYQNIPSPGAGNESMNVLLNFPNYPDSPDAIFHPIHFEWPTGPSGSEENSTAFPPANVRDNYGIQIQGFYHANRTGPHYFAIASDDMGELFLSTDDSFANLQLIAEEPAWNQIRDFGTPARRPMVDVGTPDERQSNWSKGIFLEEGRAYAIMARVYEHGGGDSLAVAHNDHMFFWDGMDPIPGSFLSADLQGNQGGPLIAPIPDQEVTVNTTLPPIDLFLGDPLFPGRDIEVRVESDNQFILPNEDILLGRPGQDILLGEQPNDLLLPGGEILPVNSPPFGGGNDLLDGNGPAGALLGQGIQADQIDHRVIILPPLRRTGAANLTVIATNPNGDESRLQFGISIISNEIILIDDGDAGFATSGVWGKSNALFSHDGDSLISNHAGSTAKYTPNLPGPGTYAVYAKWASRNPSGGKFDRDHGARYTVNHAGGSMTTTVNQTQNEGKFNLIGIYDFVGDGSDCVILERVNVIGGFTSADAVRFVATTSTNGNEQPGDLIVDNLSPGFSTSSNWHPSNATDGYAGGSLFTEVVGNMATFTPGTAPDGIYEVYVHASARSARGRTYRRDSKAQFEVRHAMGTSLVEVNQNVLPGQWIFIGAFQFDASGDASVKLTRMNEDSTQKTVADAVRFTPLQPIRSTEVIVDNKDAGFSSFGNWNESNALDEYLQSSLAGFGTGTSAKWTPELPSPGKYQVFARWANQGTNGALKRDSKAWYSVQHSGGKPSIVRVNQNANGGNWVSIGTFDFTGDGSEFVQLFSGFASQASISADAIRFLLVE